MLSDWRSTQEVLTEVVETSEKRPTVLVVGASGFLGSHIVRSCIDRGLKVRAGIRTLANHWRLKEFNPDGAAWVDPGLGGFLAGVPRFAHLAEQNLGKHKVPTLRNVDKRPSAGFVKAFGHNGVFKSLKEIVHFYNTRDVLPACEATPDAKPGLNCWGKPEVAANLNTEELGNLGLTEEEAREKYGAVKVGKFPFSANGKAFLQGEGDGVVKIIADGDSGTVLGVHILGPHASDLIQEGTLAVAAGAKITDLEELIHPHPTLSEAVWEAALAVNKAPIHLALRA